MLDINEIHNSNLEVVELDGHEFALKSFVLFTNIDNKNVIAITKEYINVSFDYLSKYPQLDNEVVFLDEISFERLYNKFIEARTDKQMSDITTTTEESVVEDDDMDISEFLKTSADIMTDEESAPIIKFVNSLFCKNSIILNVMMRVTIVASNR